jgi:hypothetical protein
MNVTELEEALKESIPDGEAALELKRAQLSASDQCGHFDSLYGRCSSGRGITYNACTGTGLDFTTGHTEKKRTYSSLSRMRTWHY